MLIDFEECSITEHVFSVEISQPMKNYGIVGNNIINLHPLFILGPTRPKDKVEIEDVPKDFQSSLTKKFDQSSYDAGGVFNIDIDGQFNSIKDGSILLSSIGEKWIF